MNVLISVDISSDTTSTSFLHNLKDIPQNIDCIDKIAPHAWLIALPNGLPFLCGVVESAVKHKVTYRVHCFQKVEWTYPSK